MELLFIAAFAAYGMYTQTKAEFKDWGHRKLDAGRSRIAAKRADFRPGGTRRSPKGRLRVRDLPARGWWAFADVMWSLGRALKEGAKSGAEQGRERYRNRKQATVVASDEADAAKPASLPGPFDGDPEFQKLKAIRDTGYTGPIDQDGNKVTEDQFIAQHRPTLVPPIPFIPITQRPVPAALTPGGSTMADAGTFEQVGAMLQDMKTAALFALEDAQNDLKRAEEDESTTEAMVAFAESITAGASYVQPLARTGETSGAMTKAKQDAVAAAEAHVAAIEDAMTANLRMME